MAVRTRRRRKGYERERDVEFRPSTHGRGGLAGQIDDLQQKVGNKATTILLNSMSPLSSLGGPRAGFAKGDTIALEDVDGGDAAEKGTGFMKEDGGTTTADPAKRPGRHGVAGSGMMPLRIGTVDLHVATDETPGMTAGKSEDLVAGTVGTTFTNPDNKTTKPFGSEAFQPTATNGSLNISGGTHTVNFTIAVNCPWGTNSGGKTDVPSATDSVVTKDSYTDIVSDLTPALKEKSWVAPRKKYWSNEICRRHERYHSIDDKGWAEGAGKQYVVDYLKDKPISPMTAALDAVRHLNDSMAAMKRANMQFYKGGETSYYSYKGEERAFGDGKQPYLDLAAGVKAQGERLEAEAKGEEEKAAANQRAGVGKGHVGSLKALWEGRK